VWRLAVNNVRMSAVKCSYLRQPITHPPHHVLEAFRPFLVKVAGAAQSDFALVQLQVETAAQLDLSWCAKE